MSGMICIRYTAIYNMDYNHWLLHNYNLQLVASMANDLQFGNNLLTAEFENQAGVELANISENEQNSYDFLIGKKKRKTTRKSYKKEAFLCFRESRKLGSTKGTFNLGLCYEQGLGTRVDLAKVQTCSTSLQQNLTRLFHCRQQGAMKTQQRRDTLWPSTT